MDNKFVNVLPDNWDGTWPFSNPDDEDFVGKWGGKDYVYPAQKTTNMVILDATPLEIQNIRKKFARELAERMFFKSTKYEAQRAMEGVKDENGVIQPRLMSFKTASSYTDGDLAGYIQKCLSPLPKVKQVIMESEKPNLEDKLTRDTNGEANTQIATPGKPLRLKDRA